MAKKKQEDNELELIECGGASLVESRVCFDPNNEYVFCTSGKNVRIFRTETGECVGTLHHESIVVGALIDEENVSRLLTCTQHGAITAWTYEDGKKQTDWHIPEVSKIVAFMVPKYDPQTWFVVEKRVKKSTLTSLTRTKKGLSKTDVADVIHPTKVSIHDDGSFAAYGISSKLWIRDLKNSKPASPLTGSETNVTIVQCHPSKDSVATGDELGRIRIWHKVLGQRPMFTLYHWHSLPISDIAFSREGTTMYSGGGEQVVVRWSLYSSSKEETKDFLPRCGANIQHLVTSTDSSLVAISLQDNSITIATSQLKPLKSIQGFVHNVVSRSSEKEQSSGDRRMICPTGLLFDHYYGGESMDGLLITNGRPGYLQFYDAGKDAQRMNLDVIGKNQPPAERGRPPSYFEVVRAAVCNGWLATIDHRADKQYTAETNLKFWKFDEESKSFKLNTWITRPHSELVTSLLFRRPPQNGKSEPMSLVSTGDDGKFKIWELSIETNIYESKEVWICERAGYYRGQSALCGDFSITGDLAIGFGHTATIWNYDEHEMKTAISVLPVDNPIRTLQFGVAKDEQHLLVVLSDHDLAVWDSIAHVCLWRLTTKPDSICKDFSSGSFAAFFGSKVCLFRPRSPEPTHTAVGTNFKRAVAAVFASEMNETIELGSGGLSPLYFVTPKQKLMCLRMKSDGDVENEETAISNSSTARTPFAELLAASKTSKQKRMATVVRSYETNIQLLSGASHTLPTVAAIGPRFVESCLARKEATAEEELLPNPSSKITFASMRNLYAKR